MSDYLDRLRAAVESKLDGIALASMEQDSTCIHATFTKTIQGVEVECGQHVGPTIAHAAERMLMRASAYFDRAEQEIDEDMAATQGHPPTLLGRMKPVGAWLNPTEKDSP